MCLWEGGACLILMVSQTYPRRRAVWDTASVVVRSFIPLPPYQPPAARARSHGGGERSVPAIAFRVLTIAFDVFSGMVGRRVELRRVCRSDGPRRLRDGKATAGATGGTGTSDRSSSSSSSRSSRSRSSNSGPDGAGNCSSRRRRPGGRNRARRTPHRAACPGDHHQVRCVQQQAPP